MLASTFRATISGELLIFKPSFLLPEHPFQVPLNLFVNGEGSFHSSLPLSPVNIQRTRKPLQIAPSSFAEELGPLESRVPKEKAAEREICRLIRCAPMGGVRATFLNDLIKRLNPTIFRKVSAVILALSDVTGLERMVRR